MDVDVAVERKVLPRQAVRAPAPKAAEDDAARDENAVDLRDPLDGQKIAPPKDPAGPPSAPPPSGPSGGPSDPLDPGDDLRGMGRALPVTLRLAFEAALDQDFSHVRIHDDAASRAAADAMGAQAFTNGRDIVLGSGAGRGPALDRVLAHELVHVVQAAEGRMGSTAGPVPVSHPIEREAYGRENEVLAKLQAARRGDDDGHAAPSAQPSAFDALEGAWSLLMDVIGGPDGQPDSLSEAMDGLVGDLSGGLAEALLATEGGGEGALDAAWAEVLGGLGMSGLAAMQDLPTLDLLGGLLGQPGVDQAGPDRKGQGPDGAAAETVRLGPVIDVDAERASLTADLLTQFAAALGIDTSGLRVQATADAGRHARAQGTHGLTTQGRVMLDPEWYDPSTREGQRLLAHELVHVAQHQLGSRALEHDDLALAETEAHVQTDALLAGGGLSAPIVGLASGAMAADGPAPGADLVSQYSQYQGMVHGSKNAIGPVPPKSGERPDASAQENTQEKLKRYKNGVSGIADMIGDLDAFSELCSAVSDGQSTIGPMYRIKGSDSYKQLKEMWQGAVDGGSVAAEMQRIFNNEFDGRGFWGSTEQAFDIVEDNAKRDAKRDAEAEKARQDAEKAQADKDKVQDPAKVDDPGSSGNKSGEKTDGADKIDPKLAALMDDAVNAKADSIPLFDDLKKVTDEQLASIVYERNHQVGLIQEVGSGGLGTSRTSQVMGTLFSNLGSSFGKSFTEQFADTMILDTLGSLADKAMPALTKGAIKTPFIGPMIGLIQNKPWTGKFWSDQGDGLGKGGKQLADIFSTLGHLGKAQSTGDVVGILCDAIADLFGGLADILSVAQNIIGTLSAVCYIAGAVMIAVGIALIWLGFGAGLISAGGWLVRAGGILARINTVLGTVVLVLTALTMLFRTAAAFLVPADMYAENLVAVGESASTFGDKAGAKVADTTAGMIKEKASQKIKGPKTDAPANEGDGVSKGQQDASKIRGDIDKTNQNLDAKAKEAKKLADQQGDDPAKGKQKQPDGPDDTQGKKPAQGDGEAPKKKSSLVDKVKKVGSALSAPGKQIWKEVKSIIPDIKSSFKDLGRLMSEAPKMGKGADAGPMAKEALQPFADARKRVDDARQKVDELKKHLETLDPASADAKAIASELKSAQRELGAAKWLSPGTRDQPDSSDRRKKGVKQSNDLLDSVEAPQKQRAAKPQEATGAKERMQQLEKDIKAKKKQLAEAEKKQTKATEDETRLKGEQDANQKHIDGMKAAQKKQAEAKDLQTKKDGLTKEITELRKEADNAPKADTLRQQTEDHKAKAEQLKADNKSTLQELNAKYKDVRVKVEMPDGTVGRRTIQRVDSNGVWVLEGRKQVHIPFDKLTNETLRTSGETLAKNKQQLQTEQEQATAKESQAKALNPSGKDVKTLRGEIDTKTSQADATQVQLDQAHSQSKYGGSDKSLDHHQQQDAALKKQLGESSSAKSTSGDDAGRLKAEISKHEGDLTTAREIHSREEHEKYTGSSAGGKTGGARNLIGTAVGQSSSGNATGGVGSAFKEFDPLKGAISDLLLSIGGALSSLTPGGGDDAFMKEVATETAARKDKKDKGKDGGDDSMMAPVKVGLDKLFGVQDKEAIKKVGQKQAQVEELAQLTPPADLELMMKARDDARTFYQAYIDAHDNAYMCFVAEQEVGKLAQGTQNLAEAGKPVKKAAQKQWDATRKGKETEQKRDRALAQKNKDPEKADSGLSGIVTDLIMKLASNSDAMKKQPNPGSKEGGKNIANQQNESGEQSKKQKKASQDASAKQRDFLDTAIVAAKGQEEFADVNIKKLSDKHQAELQLRTEIQLMKAQSIAERDQAKTQVETHSSNFLASYQTLQTWAEGYKKKREALQFEGGSGGAGLASSEAHSKAAQATAGPGTSIPHQAKLEAAFGTDLGHIRAHTGVSAQTANKQLGSTAFASGTDIAFASSSPSLRTTAHEVAHTFQQEQGVQLEGGVGAAGDRYEREADAIADRVVRGESVVDMVGGGGGSAGEAVQFEAGAKVPAPVAPANAKTGTPPGGAGGGGADAQVPQDVQQVPGGGLFTKGQESILHVSEMYIEAGFIGPRVEVVPGGTVEATILRVLAPKKQLKKGTNPPVYEDRSKPGKKEAQELLVAFTGLKVDKPLELKFEYSEQLESWVCVAQEADLHRLFKPQDWTEWKQRYYGLSEKRAEAHKGHEKLAKEMARFDVVQDDSQPYLDREEGNLRAFKANPWSYYKGYYEACVKAEALARLQETDHAFVQLDETVRGVVGDLLDNLTESVKRDASLRKEKGEIAEQRKIHADAPRGKETPSSRPGGVMDTEELQRLTDREKELGEKQARNERANPLLKLIPEGKRGGNLTAHQVGDLLIEEVAAARKKIVSTREHIQDDTYPLTTLDLVLKKVDADMAAKGDEFKGVGSAWMEERKKHGKESNENAEAFGHVAIVLTVASLFTGAIGAIALGAIVLIGSAGFAVSEAHEAGKKKDAAGTHAELTTDDGEEQGSQAMWELAQLLGTLGVGKLLGPRIMKVVGKFGGKILDKVRPGIPGLKGASKLSLAQLKVLEDIEAGILKGEAAASARAKIVTDVGEEAVEGASRYVQWEKGLQKAAATEAPPPGGGAPPTGVGTGDGPPPTQSTPPPSTKPTAGRGPPSTPSPESGPPSGRGSEPHASTPVGRRDAPMHVGSDPPAQAYPKIVGQSGNTPGTVAGRKYTGKAFDGMQGRQSSQTVTPSAVEGAIEKGPKIAGSKPGTFVHELDGLRVVVDTEGMVLEVSHTVPAAKAPPKAPGGRSKTPGEGKGRGGTNKGPPGEGEGQSSGGQGEGKKPGMQGEGEPQSGEKPGAKTAPPEVEANVAGRATPVEEAFISEFRAKNPNNVITETELRAKFRDGYRMGPTGALEQIAPDAAIKVRQAENAKLMDSPMFAADVKARGITAERLQWMKEKKCPLSFENPPQYETFRKDLARALKESGLADAQVSMKGTSTTFYSENPKKMLGHHFDANPSELADIDLGLSSSKMVDAMNAAKKKPNTTMPHIFKTKDTVKIYPELKAFAEKWKGILGRDVNFVGMTDKAPQALEATDYLVIGE